ncbi:MAG: prepilin-type N-terminal cleavage/methylation domain-containing protein [Gammaproteobacteria bacterium]|nr:prepilin-type N-terminal cleavage/methylation domain-containing protein [Gammaproteobacteria bacterium]
MKALKSAKDRLEGGFTLVELVLVLLVIGVLASLAIPKFVDLKRDAQITVLKGVVGSLNSTTAIYQPVAAIHGIKNGGVPINGDTVQFRAGFPDGHWNNAFRYILDAATKAGYTRANARCTGYRLCGVGNRSRIPGVAGTTGGRGVIIWPEGYIIGDNCFTYYYNLYDGSYPLIGSVDSGC